MGELTYSLDYANLELHEYEYDLSGNLLSETIKQLNSNLYPISTDTVYYGYSDSNWKDKLTSYDGQTITYDAIGNPLSYRDGISMTWKNGRQLATLQKTGHTIGYNYDDENIRVSKTVDGTEYTYEYAGGLLMYETRGTAKFWYYYDANGILYNVKYTLVDGGTTYSYYYTHNTRGDIIEIYNGSGNLVAKYEYDDWGNVLSVKDGSGNAITNQNHIGNLNPFRYRGYYLDTETGLYYLMSRYYDPVVHRFINADGYFQAGGGILDTNMSAYCGNNPINFYDPTGTRECPIHHEYWDPTCYICRPENAKYISKYNSKPMIDITDKLNNAMVNNAKTLEDIASIHLEYNTGKNIATIIFINNVRPMGIWDFKSQDDWGLNSEQYYIYQDRVLGFDDVGNLHYGYIGRVLFSESTLLKAGGAVQILTGTSDPSYWNSNFDDPRDQYMIGCGVDLWDQAHAH